LDSDKMSGMINDLDSMIDQANKSEGDFTWIPSKWSPTGWKFSRKSKIYKEHYEK